MAEGLGVGMSRLTPTLSSSALLGIHLRSDYVRTSTTRHNHF